MSTRMFSNTSSALLLVLFSLLVICGKRPKSERKWEAKLDKLMAPCAGSENSTLSLTFHNIICNSDNIVVNLDVVAQNDLPSPFLLEIEAEKCLSKEKLDSCIKYTKLKIDNVCAFALRGFPKDCISNLDCPMKQGFYTARNCSFDKSIIGWLPVTTEYWKLKFVYSGSKGREKLACYELHGRLVFTREMNGKT